MKLVSWNVAGIRACIRKGFVDFFNEVDADIFCVQESKVTEDQFDFRPKGYDMYLFPAVRKGYSGTLIYSKVKPLNVIYGNIKKEYDEEGRTITLEFENFYLVNVYVPNVKRDLSRMDFRMHFEDVFRKYLNQLDEKKPVIICGDFNVAHEEIDIKNAKANIGNAGFTYEERGKFSELLKSGFVDTYRHFNPAKDDAFSWWSYIGNCRARNIGWRIDYFIVSKSIIDKVSDPVIYNDVFGSDHCPIGINLKLK